MMRWLSMAVRRDIVLRSLKICAVVGTIVIIINYSERIRAGTLTDDDYFKMLMTYCVPYCVSTYVSVSAALRGQS